MLQSNSVRMGESIACKLHNFGQGLGSFEQCHSLFITRFDEFFSRVERIFFRNAW